MDVSLTPESRDLLIAWILLGGVGLISVRCLLTPRWRFGVITAVCEIGGLAQILRFQYLWDTKALGLYEHEFGIALGIFLVAVGPTCGSYFAKGELLPNRTMVLAVLLAILVSAAAVFASPTNTESLWAHLLPGLPATVRSLEMICFAAYIGLGAANLVSAMSAFECLADPKLRCG
jgi:hypothetical protein